MFSSVLHVLTRFAIEIWMSERNVLGTLIMGELEDMAFDYGAMRSTNAWRAFRIIR